MNVSSASGGAPNSVEAAMLVKAQQQQKLQGKAALDLIQSASPQPLAKSGPGQIVNTTA